MLFKWKQVEDDEEDKEHIGYIAQDVEEIAPYLVGTDEKGVKSLDYIGLLCAKVEQLEIMCEKLVARIKALEVAAT